MIGLIGLGLMGRPIGLRLLAAGHPLMVWNRSPEKALPLIREGARAATDLAEIGQHCQLILLCLSDAEAVRAVVLGATGLGVLQPQQLIVDLSSISPEQTRAIAAQTAAHWVDAPVSGGVRGAENGSLVVMAGGQEQDIDRLRPIAQAFSQRLTAMGGLGCGQVSKLCNQLIVAANSLLIAEAIALAEAAGVDATRLPSALAGGYADSLPFQTLAPRMASHQHEPVQWKVATLRKDLANVLQCAATEGLPLKLAALALQQLDQAMHAGWQEDDLSRIIDLYGVKLC